MKLIIVNRSKPDVFARLRKQFQDEAGVQVVFERRTRERRRTARIIGPDRRRSRDRRQFLKPFNGKDYIVIYISG
ncbi:MAG TPA: hypothetical protein VFO48_09060 [Vicinamibacterales bacterium]|nr:hypothetical protein [Vicinamibacterales bacterium]